MYLQTQLVSKKEKPCSPDTKVEDIKTQTAEDVVLSFFPGNLISKNHYQVKTLVKCPSHFHLKNGSKKEAKSKTNTKGKNMFE